MSVCRARKLCKELARRRPDLSAEDVRNFLQRWVIVQVLAPLRLHAFGCGYACLCVYVCMQAGRSGLLSGGAACQCSCCRREGAAADRTGEELGVNAAAQHPPSYQAWITSALCSPGRPSAPSAPRCRYRIFLRRCRIPRPDLT